LLIPSLSVAVAVNVKLPGAATLVPSVGLVSVTTGGVFPPLTTSKKMPLSTALKPPVASSRTFTCPVTVHVQYCPPTNPLTGRLRPAANPAARPPVQQRVARRVPHLDRSRPPAAVPIHHIQRQPVWTPIHDVHVQRDAAAIPRGCDPIRPAALLQRPHVARRR